MREWTDLHALQLSIDDGTEIRHPSPPGSLAVLALA